MTPEGEKPHKGKFDSPTLLAEKNPDHAFENWAVESVATLARQLLTERTAREKRLREYEEGLRRLLQVVDAVEREVRLRIEWHPLAEEPIRVARSLLSTPQP